ncbi:hypothetical protein Psuf_051610 [Phytohabitans suffuscus]|uniref:Uncharacterized protein n=1 Tax=Phytohabitans suffuscus TaxID=624315 RepID=A0A6F8YPM6_9ACTN|nr:hypothetical protein Psuf_051610 [Phytohabitans suffuscus]
MGTGAFLAAVFVAFAVVAFDAGVADRAAETRRRVLTEPSHTTVTPRSARARRIFFASAGVTAAASTDCVTSAEVSWPPARSAWAIRESVIERTSAPVWRGSVTNDLPEAMNERGRPVSTARREELSGFVGAPVSRAVRAVAVRVAVGSVNCNAVCGDHPAAHAGGAAPGAAARGLFEALTG